MIHAGLYYGPNSLKTRLCLRGKHLLYSLCKEHGIPHRRTGKWIVAQTASELEALEKLHAFASSISVPTRFLDHDEIAAREPDVRAEAGVLESPTTGIVDSHALMQYLEGAFQAQGGECIFHASVVGLSPLKGGDKGYKISTRETPSPQGETSPTSESTFPITANTVINSAGLAAPAISNALLPSQYHITPHFARGTYYTYVPPSPASRKPNVNTLLYPAPRPGLAGLGTHLTLDMSGAIRFGPDVEWLPSPDPGPRPADPKTPEGGGEGEGGEVSHDYAYAYTPSPSPSHLRAAAAAIREYLPLIDPAGLSVDYCGIRPKLGRPEPGGGGGGGTAGSPGFEDFVIRDEGGKGYAGFVNCLGIESPGLTAALGIAEVVGGIVEEGERG